MAAATTRTRFTAINADEDERIVDRASGTGSGGVNDLERDVVCVEEEEFDDE